MASDVAGFIACEVVPYAAAMTGTDMPRRRRRWLIGVVAAILLVGGGYATFIIRESPLTFAGVEVDAPTAVSYDGTAYVVRYTPDGKVILRLYLTNTGHFPVRLEGIIAPWVPDGRDGNEFISAFYKAEPLLYDGESPGPFHPVSVPVNRLVSVGVRLTMCPAGTRGSDTGHLTMQHLDLDYRYAGWRGTHTVEFTPMLYAPFYKCDYTGGHPAYPTFGPHGARSSVAGGPGASRTL